MLVQVAVDEAAWRCGGAAEGGGGERSQGGHTAPTRTLGQPGDLGDARMEERPARRGRRRGVLSDPANTAPPLLYLGSGTSRTLARTVPGTSDMTTAWRLQSIGVGVGKPASWRACQSEGGASQH